MFWNDFVNNFSFKTDTAINIAGAITKFCLSYFGKNMGGFTNANSQLLNISDQLNLKWQTNSLGNNEYLVYVPGFTLNQSFLFIPLDTKYLSNVYSTPNFDNMKKPVGGFPEWIPYGPAVNIT